MLTGWDHVVTIQAIQWCFRRSNADFSGKQFHLCCSRYEHTTERVVVCLLTRARLNREVIAKTHQGSWRPLCDCYRRRRCPTCLLVRLLEKIDDVRLIRFLQRSQKIFKHGIVTSFKQFEEFEDAFFGWDLALLTACTHWILWIFIALIGRLHCIRIHYDMCSHLIPGIIVYWFVLRSHSNLTVLGSFSGVFYTRPRLTELVLDVVNLQNLKFTLNVRTIITLRKQQKLILHDFVAISAR